MAATLSNVSAEEYIRNLDDSPDWVENMHNLIRIVGNNDVSSLREKDEAVDYLIGVAFWPLFFSLLLMLWTLLLCCPCCKRGLRNSPHRRRYKAMFLASFFLSIIGLGFMVSGAAKLQDGLNDATGGLDTLSNAMQLLSQLTGDLADVGLQFTNYFASVSSSDSCVGRFISASATYGTTEMKDDAAKMQRILSSAISATSRFSSEASRLSQQGDDLSGVSKDISDVSSDYFSLIVPLFGAMVGIYVIMAVIIIFIAVARGEEGLRCAVPKCCQCMADYVVFPSLGVLDVLFVIVAGLTFALSIIAADFCYPNPTLHILDIFDGGGSFEDRAAVRSTLVFWGACACCPTIIDQARNESVLNQRIQEASEKAQMINTQYTALSSALIDAQKNYQCGDPGVPAEACMAQGCVSQVLPTTNGQPTVLLNLTKVENWLVSLQELAGCQTVPTVYTSILNEGTCSGIQPGFAQIGIGCIVGVGFLLVALSLRSVFKGAKREGDAGVTADSSDAHKSCEYDYEDPAAHDCDPKSSMELTTI